MNSSTKRFLVHLFAGLFAIVPFSTPVFAAVVTVSTSGEAPVSNILTSVLPPTTATAYSWSKANLSQFGQTFRAPGDGSMEKLTLKTGTLGAKNAPFTLNIYRVENITDAPSAGTSIYTGTGTLPASQPPNPGYMTFTLDTPVALAAGKLYLFTLSYVGDPQTVSLGFFRGTGADSGSNVFWTSTDNGVTFASSPSIGYLYIQGSAIPEANTAMLLLPAIAGAALLIRHRR